MQYSVEDHAITHSYSTKVRHEYLNTRNWEILLFTLSTHDIKEAI